jgi:hypothetical protein
MAMGILMEQHRVTPEQAFDRLGDVAEQIIYTGDAQQPD